MAIDSIEDMRTLLDGIPLDSVSTSMTINAPAAVLLLLYQLVAEEQGVAPGAADRHDPERHPQGVHRARHLHLPAAAVAAAGRRHLRLLPRRDPAVEHDLDLRLPHGRGRRDARCRRSRSRWPTPSEYVRAALGSGLAVDEFAPRLSFFFVARTTLLEEVAKFRAARRHLGADHAGRVRRADPRSQMLRFHTQTAGVQLTAQQPEVNLARVTVQALAAVLGGTQSLHTNAYDEAIALPSREGRPAGAAHPAGDRLRDRPDRHRRPVRRARTRWSR